MRKVRNRPQEEQILSDLNSLSYKAEEGYKKSNCLKKLKLPLHEGVIRPNSVQIRTKAFRKEVCEMTECDGWV